MFLLFVYGSLVYLVVVGDEKGNVVVLIFVEIFKYLEGFFRIKIVEMG